MMFEGIKVGDKVAVILHRGSAEWTVEKVGRKYFKAGHHEFRLDDGHSTSDYSYPKAYTLEDHAKNLRSADAEKELREFGVQIDFYRSGRRERILAVHEALLGLILADQSESKAQT